MVKLDGETESYLIVSPCWVPLSRDSSGKWDVPSDHILMQLRFEGNTSMFLSLFSTVQTYHGPSSLIIAFVW